MIVMSFKLLLSIFHINNRSNDYLHVKGFTCGVEPTKKLSGLWSILVCFSSLFWFCGTQHCHLVYPLIVLSRAAFFYKKNSKLSVLPSKGKVRQTQSQADDLMSGAFSSSWWKANKAKSRVNAAL